MSKLRCHISISADGYVAGPNQSQEEPLGEGGEALHDWATTLAAWREAHEKDGGEVNASSRIIEERHENVGASLMGRNMFSGAAPTSSTNIWRRDSWTSSSSTSPRCCSAAALACSTRSGTPRSDSSSCGLSRRRVSRTSSTG